MKVKKTSGTSSNSHLLSFMYLALRGRLCRRIAGENKLFKPTLMYIYIYMSARDFHSEDVKCIKCF